MILENSDRIISLARDFDFMYRGELEVQAKRKTLAILQDEITRILNSSRDLSTLTTLLIKGADDKEIHQYLDRMRNTEEEVENLGRKITREVAEIGEPYG